MNADFQTGMLLDIDLTLLCAKVVLTILQYSANKDIDKAGLYATSSMKYGTGNKAQIISLKEILCQIDKCIRC